MLDALSFGLSLSSLAAEVRDVGRLLARGDTEGVAWWLMLAIEDVKRALGGRLAVRGGSK